jgi:hypothetical protein
VKLDIFVEQGVCLPLSKVESDVSQFWLREARLVLSLQQGFMHNRQIRKVCGLRHAEACDLTPERWVDCYSTITKLRRQGPPLRTLECRWKSRGEPHCEQK